MARAKRAMTRARAARTFASRAHARARDVAPQIQALRRATFANRDTTMRLDTCCNSTRARARAKRARA
eukprot:3623790-Lingulodinium_polyedra.AAC.1